MCVCICMRITYSPCIYNALIYIHYTYLVAEMGTNVGRLCWWMRVCYMCVCVREDPAKEMNSSDTSPFRVRYRRSVGLRALKGWSLCALYVHAQHTQPQPATGDNIMRRPPLYIHPTEGRSTRSDQWRVMTHVHLKVIAYHTHMIIYITFLSMLEDREWYFLPRLAYVNNYVSISLKWILSVLY